MNNNQVTSLSNLPVAREARLFTALAVISAIIWAFAAISIIGLLIVGICAFVFFIINGLFIARIKSESVEISSKQMPELYSIFADSCKKVYLDGIPRLHIMQQGGWLNAFATRFARRDFVVLYSDLVESFGADSKELQFIIGHELGHIKQKHITRGMFIMPAMLIPLLGSAYSRARESTCDRFGAFVADDTNASMRAALALAGGKQLYKTMNPTVFAEQNQNERGFFISLHELISTYPTLSRRVTDIQAFATRKDAPLVKKNIFAYPSAIMFSYFGIFLIYVVFIASFVLLQK